MNYKSLINSNAASLALWGKKECSCFESLSKKNQQELINAYVAKASHEEQQEISASVEQELDMNIAFLLGSARMKHKDILDIRKEFNEQVAYYINLDLSDAYQHELSNRRQHVAEYRADWEQAA